MYGNDIWYNEWDGRIVFWFLFVHPYNNLSLNVDKALTFANNVLRNVHFKSTVKATPRFFCVNIFAWRRRKRVAFVWFFLRKSNIRVTFMRRKCAYATFKEIINTTQLTEYLWNKSYKLNINRTLFGLVAFASHKSHSFSVLLLRRNVVDINASTWCECVDIRSTLRTTDLRHH